MAESLFERMSKLAMANKPAPFRLANLGKEPKMQLFTKIEGAVAIVRVGVYLKQMDLYARGDRVYLKMSAGFCRIAGQFGNEYVTVNTDVKVLEWEGDGIVEHKEGLRFTS